MSAEALESDGTFRYIIKSREQRTDGISPAVLFLYVNEMCAGLNLKKATEIQHINNFQSNTISRAAFISQSLIAEKDIKSERFRLSIDMNKS